MNTQIMLGIVGGCVALAAILALLSLHILRKEPKYLRERSQNGEILLLTFEQIMALYYAAPEKWDMQVDGPTYYPHGKEQDGLLVYLLPKERKRYRAWFDWRLSHGEDAGRFQMTTKAILTLVIPARETPWRCKTAYSVRPRKGSRQIGSGLSCLRRDSAPWWESWS